MADERPDIDETDDTGSTAGVGDGSGAPNEPTGEPAEAASTEPAAEAAPDVEGEVLEEAAGPADASEEETVTFDMDPDLAAAMAEAEASYERKHPQKSGEHAAPASGAGEGLVRALSELTQARDELEKAENKIKNLEDRTLRTAADFENFKKRVARDREDEKKFANERLLKDILPVVDNLERAIDAAGASADSQLLSGVQMVQRQVLQVLSRYGVEQFSAKGQPFNPELHEAMQQQETDEVPPGHVAVEYLRGYTLAGRLIRPAMVVVASAPASPTDAERVASGEASDSTQGDGGTET